MMRSGNPALNEKTFTEAENLSLSSSTGYMTLEGTVQKTAILLALLTVGAAWTWHIYFTAGSPSAVLPWLIGGGIAGLILSFITIFNKQQAAIFAPLYAICEGLTLGGISGLYESQYPGIVINAVGLTIATFAALLFAYATRLIKATENFKLGVFAATCGIGIVYLADFVLRMFHVSIPYIHDSGPIGIGISVFIVIIAALNLVMDFDFIEQGAAGRVPKYMEWYGSFGLIVTLVWLYLEILRLLSKAGRSRS